MALYMITIDDVDIVARAANGDAARAMIDLKGDEVRCTRLVEAGPPGIIVAGEILKAIDTPTDPDPDADDEDEWDDITGLGDKGLRRLRNRNTGEEKTEPR